MKPLDRLAFCLRALREERLRAGLSVLGVAVGVAAVILLTALGEGARVAVLAEFQQFGTNLLQVTPGKTETAGLPGVLGGTTHELTLADAAALRRVHGVDEVVPTVLGQARVEGGGLGRSVYVFGVNERALDVWKVELAQGSFLPPAELGRAAPVAVLGPRLARELFGERSPVGARVRIGGWRLRVIGVTRAKGRILGFDMDDCAYVPTATAMGIFDVDELHEIDVTFRHESLTDSVVAGVTDVLRERHAGNEDFTVVTQAAMLEIFDEVLRVLTAGVAGIAAVSLLVGAIGILTVLWIAVGERTGEIGLLRALGATRAEVRRLFLLESAALAGIGGLAGWAAAAALVALAGRLLPSVPVSVPLPWVAAALLGSVATGILSGLAPAGRAAALDPVEALRAE